MHKLNTAQVIELWDTVILTLKSQPFKMHQAFMHTLRVNYPSIVSFLNDDEEPITDILSIMDLICDVDALKY